MRQEVGDQMVFVRRQTLQHLFQIGTEVMLIQPGALNQAPCGPPLACPQGACEQPVFSSDGNGPNLVFRPVVVDRQLPVIEKARGCAPALWPSPSRP